MNDNTNLEKITKTILLMTEGESRRDGGGGKGGRERISRAHFAHASLHKPTVNLCFKAGDLLFQLFLFSRRLEENMSKQLFWNNRN